MISKSATGSAAATGSNCSRDSRRQEGASSLAGVQTSGIMSKRKKAAESLYYVGDSQAPLEPETKVHDDCSFLGGAVGRSTDTESGKMGAQKYSKDCSIQFNGNVAYGVPDICMSTSRLSSNSLIGDGHEGRKTQTLIPNFGQCVVCVFVIGGAVAILALVASLGVLFNMVDSIKGDLRNAVASSSSVESDGFMKRFEMAVSSVNSSVEQLWVDLEQKAEEHDTKLSYINDSLNFLHHMALSWRTRSSEILVSVTGQFSSTPAASCADILQITPTIPSGDYWIRSSNGIAIQVYCNMRKTCGGITGGWMRVAELNTRNDSSQCPSGLCLKTDSPRTCRRCESTGGCSKVEYPVHLGYSKVCGKVIAYQYGSTDGFWTLGQGQENPDGVVLSYSQPRRHIWTFVAGRTEQVRHLPACPCLHNGVGPNSSSFVGNDYFCDTGDNEFEETPRLYSKDPLWDGSGCEIENTCCKFNNPPWFFKDLGETTTNTIDMSVCRNQDRSDEDVEVEQVELYVQ